MTDTLFHKSVILKDCNFHKLDSYLQEGLEITHRKEANGENYATLQGTKSQINNYLQEAPILSDRLRTLNTLPKYRIINSIKVRVQ